MHEAVVVVREGLGGFGELRTRRLPGPSGQVVFEVLRGNGTEVGAEADATDGPVWTLRLPGAAVPAARLVLGDALERLPAPDGDDDDLDFDEQGCALLARAALGPDREDELVVVVLRQSGERALAVWRRELEGGGEWGWTADVVVVPGDLAGALCGRMLAALDRIDGSPPDDDEVAALAARPDRAADAVWRARPGSPHPGAGGGLVAQLLGCRPTGALGRLDRALGHLLSFEAAFVLFLYSNELKTVVAFPFPVDETVLFGALAIGSGALVVVREGIYLRGLPVVAAALLFIGWAVASAGWSPSQVLVRKDVAYLLTFTVLSVVAGGLIVANSRRRVARFFVLALAVGLGMALYGLYIYAAYGDFRRWAGWQDTEGRAYLAFGHTVANAAGIAFAAALFARFGSLRQTWAALAFGASALFLLVGGGRGPFLGVVLVALVGLATRPPEVVGRERRLAVPHATAAACLVLALAAGYVAYLVGSGGMTTTLARFAKLASEVENPGMIREPNRFAYWSAAYGYWLGAPVVGHGLSSFSPMFLGGMEKAGTHPHNIVLQTLCELGIVGLVLLAGFVWIAARHACFRRLRRDPLLVCALLFVITSSMSALFGRDIVGVRKFFFAVSLLSLRPPPAGTTTLSSSRSTAGGVTAGSGRGASAPGGGSLVPATAGH